VNFPVSLTPQKFRKFRKFNPSPEQLTAEHSPDFRLPTSDRLDAVAFRCTLAFVRYMTLDAAPAVSVVVPERRDPPN
jgi:hypothetical protein